MGNDELSAHQHYHINFEVVIVHVEVITDMKKESVSSS